MSDRYDLVIRNGTIVDGSGGRPFIADVAIADGTIAKLGSVAGAGNEEIDASGLLVTPGFVDIHTHYDGHVTWTSKLAPSSAHGVTTVVMGNCGVGFAPCKAQDRERLISLMSGVEDIPEIVMTEGLPWNWESFPEYLDAIAARSYDLDIATLIPHCPLRVYVMGERGAAREPATEADIGRMSELTGEAIRAGAFGLATTRNMYHRDSTGAEVASRGAAESELFALARAVQAAGGGILEATPEVEKPHEEFDLFRRIAEQTGCPVRFSLIQLADRNGYAKTLAEIAAARKENIDIYAQVIGRSVGMLYGLSLSYNPFSLYPRYKAIASLPLDARVREMRKREVRYAILNDPERLPPTYPADKFLSQFNNMFILGNPPNYTPTEADSIAAIAKRRGVRPEELAYDILLQEQGRELILFGLINFADGDYRAVEAMLRHEGTLLGLGDAGAHLGMVCDASFPTFMLTHWVRDRTDGDRLPLEQVVRSLTLKNALSMGMHDRGRVAEGYKADINVIDHERLRLYPPQPVHDLPAGGLRLAQAADGYVATIVSGVVSQRDGKPTGALPGSLVRKRLTASVGS